MNDFYQTLVSCIEEWSLDASKLLHGEAVLFPDKRRCSLAPSDHCFSVWWYNMRSSKLLCLHIYWVITYQVEFMIIHVHNFKKRLSQYQNHKWMGFWPVGSPSWKANGSTLSLEAMVLFSNSKTAQWLNSKPQAEVKVLLQKVWNAAPELKRLTWSGSPLPTLKQIAADSRPTGAVRGWTDSSTNI